MSEVIRYIRSLANMRGAALFGGSLSVASLLAGCVSVPNANVSSKALGTHIPPYTTPFAGCEALTTLVKSEGKHEVEVIPYWITQNHAKYTGTTYIFGGESPSVTVLAASDPTGEVTHKFPPAPSSQTDEVIAVIQYSYPGSKGSLKATDVCQETVSFST